MNEAKELFQGRFGTEPRVVARAPGRAELLGNHTDYNQGYVMALAVDRFITFAASPRPDDRIELYSGAFDSMASFSLHNIAKDPDRPWANYVKGLLVQFQTRGLPFGGFNAAIHSTVPLGGGLSSSAALLVSTALAVRKMHPYTLTETGAGSPPIAASNGELPPLSAAEKMTLAKVCQAAENQFVGVQCGLLDYISSLFGQREQVVLIDCLNLSVERTPLHGEVAAVICASGVKHALVAGEYNSLRQHCESAARSLGVTALRFVGPQELEAGRPKLSARDYECAFHVVGENDRVVRGAEMLRQDRLADFGQLLFQSHASSRDSFKNSCPELDVLVELARNHPGCLGARLSGGGFGGATINLVKRDAVESFREQIRAGYAKQTGRELDPWVCEVVDGAA